MSSILFTINGIAIIFSFLYLLKVNIGASFIGSRAPAYQHGWLCTVR